MQVNMLGCSKFRMSFAPLRCLLRGSFGVQWQLAWTLLPLTAQPVQEWGLQSWTTSRVLKLLSCGQSKPLRCSAELNPMTMTVL